MTRRLAIVLAGAALLGAIAVWRARGDSRDARAEGRPAAGKAAPRPESAQAVASPVPAKNPPANPRDRTAWREGYRTAAEKGTRQLSGRMTAGGEPLTFQEFFVEWVFSFDGSVAPARSVEVRVDPEGTRWIRRTVRTGRDGSFAIDDLPDVQLRVQVGARVFPMPPTEGVHLALDRAP